MVFLWDLFWRQPERIAFLRRVIIDGITEFYIATDAPLKINAFSSEGVTWLRSVFGEGEDFGA